MVRRNATPQAQLHFLPDLPVLIRVHRADRSLDRLVRSPSTLEEGRGVVVFLWVWSIPAGFSTKCEAGGGPDVGPIEAVGLAIQPLAAFRNGILSARKVGGVKPVGCRESGGRQPAQAARCQAPHACANEQRDSQWPNNRSELRYSNHK